jgi:YihY family inner membrane protein
MLVRMPDPPRWRIPRLIPAIVDRAWRDDVRLLAAAVTYYAFLSLFPLMLLALSVIGFVLSGNAQAQQEWIDRLAGTIPGLGPSIERNLQAVVNDRVQVGVIGLLGLLWTGAGLTRAARAALARIFRRPRERFILKRLAQALLALVALGILALVSIAATAFLAGVGGDHGVPLALRVLGIVATAALDLAFALITYRLLTPGPGPSFRDLLPAGVVLVAGWTVLKVAGAWYTDRVVARATAVYGALAAAIGILAILSLAAYLFVYGAELSAIWSEGDRGVAAD